MSMKGAVSIKLDKGLTIACTNKQKQTTKTNKQTKQNKTVKVRCWRMAWQAYYTKRLVFCFHDRN